MPENLIFHESFDSTRTADRGAQPNLAQAQAEALVSLLLGHTLAVTNTYAFDSRGVLDLVPAVLSARDEVSSKSRNPVARERLAQASPFQLSWHGAQSFFQACAKQLRTIEPLDKRFLLSAWGAIDLEVPRRLELADALLATPHPKPPAWLQEYDDFPEHFDALRAINDFAAQYGRGTASNPEPGTDLITYLEYYHQLGADDGPLRTLAKASKCPEDIAMALWQRLDEEMARAAKNDADRLKSRSWVYVAAREAREQERDDLELLELLKELIDTFYNARLAQSAYADSDFLSSVPRSSDDDGLRRVNDLAVHLIGQMRSDTSRPPLEGVFTAPSSAPQLPVEPLRRLFVAFWEVIEDDERHRTWQASCNRVNGLLLRRSRESASARSPASARAFTEAWNDHLTLLSRQLPGVVRTDDGTLYVTTRQGNVNYQQIHRVQSVDPGATIVSEEADAILAAGRYLTNLAEGVSA